MTTAKTAQAQVKPEKIETVAAIKKTYADTAGQGGALVFAEYAGLKVEDLFKLRKSLREKSVRLQVLKNTLLRRALEESGVQGAKDYLKGPIAVAFSPDEVSAPKIMTQFAKEMADLKIDSRKLVIKGGVVDGKTITAKEVAVLATLPSREEVLSKLLALINAPAVQLLRLIKEPGARVARVVNALSEKK